MLGETSETLLTRRFAVDFGKGKRVAPTHYTLSYGSSGALACPRNWLLQGTNVESAILA